MKIPNRLQTPKAKIEEKTDHQCDHALRVNRAVVALEGLATALYGEDTLPRNFMQGAFFIIEALFDESHLARFERAISARAAA